MRKSEALKCVLDCVISSEAFSLGYTPEEKYVIMFWLTSLIQESEMDESPAYTKQEDLTK